MHRLSHSFIFFFFNDTATTEIYTLSLHDALPIWTRGSCTRQSNTSGARRRGRRQVAETLSGCEGSAARRDRHTRTSHPLSVSASRRLPWRLLVSVPSEEGRLRAEILGLHCFLPYQSLHRSGAGRRVALKLVAEVAVYRPHACREGGERHGPHGELPLAVDLHVADVLQPLSRPDPAHVRELGGGVDREVDHLVPRPAPPPHERARQPMAPPPLEPLRAPPRALGPFDRPAPSPRQ